LDVIVGLAGNHILNGDTPKMRSVVAAATVSISNDDIGDGDHNALSRVGGQAYFLSSAQQEKGKSNEAS
jgi:hypothetical protein